MKLNVLSFGVAVIYFCTVASTSSAPRAPPPPPAKKHPHGCDCYTISGPDPGYFRHYKLWDFRAVDLKKHASLNLSEPIDYGDEDWDDDDHGYDEDLQYGHLSPGVHEEKDTDPRSLVFYKTSFERDWSSQNWERPGTPIAPVPMVNSKHNVFLTRDYERNYYATYLVLRTTRFSEYTSTAEIETRIRNIYRCSVRVRLRLLPAGSAVSEPPQLKEWPSRDPKQHPTVPLNKTIPPLRDDKPPDGACAGIFTYHDQNCESDIEILTRDPAHRVHYANQPDYNFTADHEIPGASTIADLPVPWTTWSTHRLDWLSDMSRWYVDNEMQDAKTYGVPDLESMIILNLWSDGGLWTGDMRIGDSIYFGIEYIELLYNRSSDSLMGHHVSPSQNHTGHQRPPLTNGSIANGYPFEPDRKHRHEMCKPGKQGRECRRKKWRNRPLRESCQRPCNIDEF